jgi:hypothetical protein
MTAGTNTYNGMAVPLNGNATIVPDSDSLDALTIATSASFTGNGVCVTGTFLDLDSCQNVFYANVTAGGSKGTGAQFNAFAADIVLDGTPDSATSPYYGGGYIYISKSGTWTGTSAIVYGFCLDMQETGTVDYRANLWLQNTASIAATSVDTYILFSGQGAEGGKTASMMYYQGIYKPTYFLHLADSTVSGMFSDSAVSGASGSSAGLHVRVGDATMQIALYAAS